MWSEIFFISLFERSFEMMKNVVCLIVLAFLVAEWLRFWFMQIRCLVTSQCGHCCKTTKFGISVLMLSLQSWNFAGWLAARTAHCDSVYYITAATYSLPDLYLPKMKKCLIMLLQSLTYVLVLCTVHIHSHQLNEQQEQIALVEGGKLWFCPLNGEDLEPVVICHGNVMGDI